jgi:hypothetical protein
MAQLLGGRLLLHFSQKFGYFFNGVSWKSQANNRAGPGFLSGEKMTKCIASQAPVGYPSGAWSSGMPGD